MSWNYRVMLMEGSYAIHDVFYDRNGKMRTRTVDPVHAIGDSLDDLKADLLLMLNATTKPVLTPEDIPSIED